MFGMTQRLSYLWDMNETNTPTAMYAVTETTTTRGFNGLGTCTTTSNIVGLTFGNYSDAAEAAKAYAKRTGATYLAPGIEATPGATIVEVAIK